VPCDRGGRSGQPVLPARGVPPDFPLAAAPQLEPGPSRGTGRFESPKRWDIADSPDPISTVAADVSESGRPLLSTTTALAAVMLLERRPRPNDAVPTARLGLAGGSILHSHPVQAGCITGSLKSPAPNADAALGGTRAAIVCACLLHRRAGRRAVGAEDAAVARLRTEQHAATFAVVEELAGVGGHGLDLSVTAVWAGNGRLGLGHALHLCISAYTVIARNRMSPGRRT
jgi:hypothetical protein